MTDSLFTDEPLPEKMPEKDSLFTDEPLPDYADAFGSKQPDLRIDPKDNNLLIDAAKNVGPDLLNVAAENPIKTGLYDIPKGILESPRIAAKTGLELAEGKPLSETTFEQEKPDFSKNPIAVAKGMVRPVTHPVEFFREHPVQQALNVAGVLGGAKALSMPKAPIPKSASIIEAAPKIEPIAIPKGAARSVEEIMRNATDEGFPKPPPKPAAPPPPAAAPDPLSAINEFRKNTQSKIEANPNWQEKLAKYIKNEVADMRGKDIHLRDPMIRSLDRKNPLAALEKAEDLMDYAAQEGYFKPTLTDVARKDLIKSRISETGKNIGAARAVGSQRGSPPIPEIRQAVKNELVAEYGKKASREIKTVLDDFDRMAKQDPSFEGLSKVATYLNGEKKTFNSIGQNEGPTIDAANIIGRLNNESLRKVLTPDENVFYTKNLKDFGAHKKLEQMVASGGRKAMTGRGAPGGALSSLWQQIWDRGGYRMGGNLADKMSSWMLENPGKLKTIPDFFEELAHHAGEVFDETLDIQGKAYGGIVEPHRMVHDHIKREFSR